jgi:hypothetical protein
MGRSLRAHLGYLDICTELQAVGWATTDGEPAEVEILLNGQRLARVQCNVERTDLRLHGLAANAGFSFTFPRPLAASDEVSVCFTDGTHLRNSPNNSTREGPDEQAGQRITIVAGMRGSGTSLCANLVALLGIPMREESDASRTDGLGNWERDEIVHYHDRVLRLFDPNWPEDCHALSLPPNWWTAPMVRAIRDEMIDWLAVKLKRTRNLGFKDPRTVRLLPLWDQICAELRLDVRWVFCVRDPAQVARPPRASDEMAIRNAEYRWMAYNSHAIRNLGDRAVCIIPYEEWFAEAGRNLTQLISHLDNALSANMPIFQELSRRVIAANLRHENRPSPNTDLLTGSLHRAILQSAPQCRFSPQARDTADSFIAFQELVGAILVPHARTASSLSHQASETARWRLPPDIVEKARGDNLFAQMDVKNILAERRLQAPEAFEAYRQLLRLQDSDHIRLRPLRSLNEIAAQRGLTYFETDPGGEPFTIESARVIGKSNHRTLKGISRPIYLACLADARVRGRSAAIELSEAILLDYQGDELKRLDDRLEFDPAIFRAQGDTVWAIAVDRRSCSIAINEAFSLLGPHTYYFGHWIWECLPKYVAALLSNKLPPIPVLIDADMPKTHRQALELVMPEGTPLIELAPFMTARVERLWCSPSQMHMPLLERMNERFKWDYLASPPARFAPIIRGMAQRMCSALPPKGGAERVFLARKPSAHRRMINDRVIEAVAQAHGFHVVYPEDLDFLEQVHLLRNARFVTGPEGSAFFLGFFSSPGTRMCILDHPHTAGLPLLTGPLAEIGVEPVVFTGPYASMHDEWPHMSDYEIDEKAFSRFLNGWLRDNTP